MVYRYIILLAKLIFLKLVPKLMKLGGTLYRYGGMPIIFLVIIYFEYNIFELILWRVQMSIEKLSPTFFKQDGIYKYYFIYFYSKIRTMGGRSFFNENTYHFHNNTQFCIFKFLSRYRNKYGFCNISRYWE